MDVNGWSNLGVLVVVGFGNGNNEIRLGFGDHLQRSLGARGGSILYDMWGLKAPEAIQETMVDGDGTYEVISTEALPEYAGDYILYGVLADTDSSYVEDSQLWNNLEAVQNGLVMPYEQVAYMHRDPITLNGQLDDFVEFFRSTADKAAGEEEGENKA